MPLDFPNSPSIGQTYGGPGGVIWSYDGAKWTNGTTSTGYAPIASPVFTGDPQAPTAVPGDADASIATTAFVAAAVAPALHNVGRNLLHNPLFNVAQRGPGNFTAGGFTMDRWRLNFNLDTTSVNQGVLSDGQRAQIGDEAATYCLGHVFTGNAGAAAYSFLGQNMEGIRRLAGKTITVSFWAWASAALKLAVSIDQYFGTGGSPSASVTGPGTAVTLSTTWTRYSLTLAVPSVSGKTVGTNGDDWTGVDFWYSSGANQATRAGNIGVQSGTVQLWGVQLEIGSAATPLEKPDPRYDLSNCQRFYQNGNFFFYGYGLAASTPGYLMGYSATMRAGPAVSFNTTSSTNATATVSSYGPEEIAITANVVAAGNFGIQGTWTASADL